MRAETCVSTEFLLIDCDPVAIESDRLLQISLGQENPRTRMKGGPDELNQRAVGRLGVSPPWTGSRIVGLLKSVLTRQCPGMCRIAIQARRADTSSAGSREAPVCLERTLKRPERPTQTCGMPEGSLAEVADSNSGWLIQIVSTLRAFCFFRLYDEWRGLKQNL